MRARAAFVPLLMLLASSAAGSVPGDGVRGKRLHDANCTGCHGTQIYTRDDRRVRSLSALKQQAERCVGSVKKRFSPLETQDLLKYLNDGFYRFAATSAGTAISSRSEGFIAAAPARDFDLAIKLAGSATSAAERDRRYALIVDGAILARDFPAADRAARLMSTPALRDEQFRKIVGSCPAN